MGIEIRKAVVSGVGEEGDRMEKDTWELSKVMAMHCS